MNQIIKLTSLVLLIVFIFSSCDSTKITTHSIAFYNVENLFDTINDAGVNDGRYTPENEMPWNTERYNHKLNQLTRVIKAMDTVNGFPVIIGLSEIENENVLIDLANHDSIKDAAYSYLHKNSPDERGIDVAMLYQSEFYLPLETNFINVNLPDSGNTTRDILYSKGILAGTDTLHIFFNHWVSRWGGQEKTEPLRIFIAKKLKQITDSIMEINPNSAIILAGDLNDNPTDTSVLHVLGALKPEISVKEKKLYNLSLSKFENGEGSLYYRSWDMFDQFIVSSSMLKEESPIHLLNNDQQIVKYDWMLYKPKKGEPRPSRTAAKYYYGGFSDHLPVMINITVRRN